MTAGAIWAAIQAERNGLDLLLRLLQADRCIAALDLIDSCEGRLIFTGVGKSGIVAHKLAGTFTSLGQPSFYIPIVDALHGELGKVTTGDVMIALSWSGTSPELQAVIAYCNRFRVPLIGITAGADSLLAREANVAVVLPQADEALPAIPTTSTTMQMALGDALAVGLMAKRKLVPADIEAQHALWHPGGAGRATRDTLYEMAEVTSQPPVDELDPPAGIEFHKIQSNIALEISQAFRDGRKLLICGNGGSAADAEHIAAEFVGRYAIDRIALPALALTNSAALTAIGNDYGFAAVFERQLDAFGQEGDILLALSTSGRSVNVLRAMQRARHLGMVVVGITGDYQDANEFRSYAHYALVVPSRSTPVVQQATMEAAHKICAVVENRLCGTGERGTVPKA